VASREITVYGIPSCDSVRRARLWLEQRGVQHQFVDLRERGLPVERAALWLRAFGSAAMRNTSGAAYRALPAEKANWDDTRWASEFARDPMLVKRPVVEVDGAPVQVGFRATTELERALQADGASDLEAEPVGVVPPV